MNDIKNSFSTFSEYGFQAYYAIQFLLVWMYPEKYNVAMINDLAVLMAFEFVMVHSGVFMAFLPRKTALFIFFPLFYGLFAYGFNKSVINTNILYIYLATVLNRMLFAFSTVSIEFRALQMGKAAAKAAFYLILIFVVLFSMDFIPKLGLTDEYLQKSNYFSIIKSGGIFTEKPYIPLCMGFIYYSLPVLYFLYQSYKKINFSNITSKTNKKKDFNKYQNHSNPI